MAHPSYPPVAPAPAASRSRLLAWVYAQQERPGDPLVPSPGTKRVKWLEQNVAALDLTLTADELSVLDPLAAEVTGRHATRPRRPRCGGESCWGRRTREFP
jgi:diketogulonate reductase-like aldo/keto reductase